MTKLDEVKFKKLLYQRLEEIRSLTEVSQESAAPVELDQQVQGRLSRMDALQGQAMAQETLRRRSIELQKIEAALQRIEAGDYGYCLSCDEEVSKRRLEHDPAAVICISCAEKVA